MSSRVYAILWEENVRADGILNINLKKFGEAQAILFSCRIFRRSTVKYIMEFQES